MLDPDPYPDPYSMNPDPQHWLEEELNKKKFCQFLLLLYPVPNPAAMPIPGSLGRNVHTSVANPDLLFRDPDPSIIKQKCQNGKKNIDSYCFVTSYDFLS